MCFGPFPILEGTAVQVGAIFRKANSERSRKCRAGSAFRRDAQTRQRAASRKDGVVFRSMGQGTPPRRRRIWRLRTIFLGDAATPPRPDARRGFALFKMTPLNHISLSRPLWTRL